jgi:hypothetical protein
MPSGPLSYENAHRTAHGYAHGTSIADAGSSDPYGYGGYPGNSMLVNALAETRAAILLQSRPSPLGKSDDLGGVRPWGGGLASLPVMEQASRIKAWGRQPRDAIATFELLSSVSFSCPTAATGHAVLMGNVQTGGVELAKISRPDRTLFEGQLDLVDSESSVRDRRYTEVLSQVAPPIAFYASIVNLRAGRHNRTMDLLDAAVGFANTVVMRFKHAFACPRPSDYSAAIQPMIEIPGHGSFPAGHACEGHVIANVLSGLVPGGDRPRVKKMLRDTALRIGHNRVVAGLHFPVDNLAGRLLGDALSAYFIAHCSGVPWTGGQFTGSPLSAPLAVPQDSDAAFHGVGCSPMGSPTPTSVNPILGQMWTDAAKEWEDWA